MTFDLATILFFDEVNRFQFFFIFSYFADGFAFAGESLTGKAVGAKDNILLSKTVRQLMYWGMGAAIITSLAYLAGIDIFMKALTSNHNIRELAKEYSFWVIIIPITSTAAFMWDGIYVGVTASKEMRNVMIISSVIVFLPAYYLTQSIWGNDALWFALNLFMAARTLLMWVRWNNVKSTHGLRH